jgi:sugar PTS system EIIA component
MIHWLPLLTDTSGLPIKSPATGTIMPLSAHPDFLYSADVLPQGICIKLQQGSLVAPFSGQYSCSLQGGRRLSFKHQSGLQVQLDLPESINSSRSSAVKHLIRSGQSVHAGQSVIKLDLQLLHAEAGCIAVLMIVPHPAIAAVSSAARFVEAGQDTAFIIQLKNR